VSPRTWQLLDQRPPRSSRRIRPAPWRVAATLNRDERGSALADGSAVLYGRDSPRSSLFDTRRLELPTRLIDQKVFQNEGPLPAIQWPAAVTAFYSAV